MKSFRLQLLIATQIWTLGGCQPDTIVVEGKHIDYKFSPELQPCGGTPEYVDNFAPFGMASFGRPLDELPHNSFAWLDDNDFRDLRHKGCKGTIGCSVKNRAFSHWPVHLHESAHALFFAYNHDPLPFLSEGLAEALDTPNGLTLSILLANDPDLADLQSEALGDAHSIDYSKARLFSLYLIQMYSPQKFFSLYSKSKRGMAETEFEDLFSEVMGESLDESVARFVSDMACPIGITAFPPYECGAPLITGSSAVGWFFTREVRCLEDEDVRGGVESDWGAVVGVTVDVDTSGLFELEFLSGETNSFAQIGSCGGCRWLSPQYFVGNGESVALPLEAGRHFLLVRLQDSSAAPISLSIAPKQ